MCEICSKLTIKTPVPCKSVISIKLLCKFIEIALRHGAGVFIVNFKNISLIFLVFLLLTLNK